VTPERAQWTPKADVEAIPLEMNAYELNARLATALINSFSVETGVQKWIDAGKF
jgi:hypothetical protein